MKTPVLQSLILIMGSLIPFAVSGLASAGDVSAPSARTAQAGGVEDGGGSTDEGGHPGRRDVGQRVLSVWTGPALVVDVASYGVEQWSSGLFLKAGAVFSRALAFSVRSSLLYENSAFALRAAATADLYPLERRVFRTENGAGGGRVHLSPYAGGGVAWRKYGSYRLDPMISAGLDIGVSFRFALTVGGNLLLEKDDTDLEVSGGLCVRVR